MELSDLLADCFSANLLDSVLPLTALESDLHTLNDTNFEHFWTAKFPFEGLDHLATSEPESSRGSLGLNCLELSLRCEFLDISTFVALEFLEVMLSILPWPDH
jgi:hypothetical protein